MLVSVLCLAIHPAIDRAFHKHAKGPVLRNAFQLRRVVRELGTDLSVPNSKKLLEEFDNTTLNISDVHRMIETTASTSPVKYLWLVVDPNDNGIRARRPHWNRFAKAGLVAPTRIAHYGAGLASLAVGTIDFFDFVAHTGFQSVAVDDAVVHGCVHVSAAVLSLSRFDYKWTPNRPFYLWMKTARDASMWPSFLITAWYTASIASTFVAPAEDAWFSMTEPSFQCATWIATIVLLYGAARAILEESNFSGVYHSRLANSLQVIATMCLPITADTLKCALLADEPYYTRFTDLVALHPQYTQIYIGAALTAMYLGSVACALSSAEHHHAVTKSEVGDFTGCLTAFAAFMSIYAMLTIEDGRLAASMIDLLFDAIFKR